jgi:hypothetical protein
MSTNNTAKHADLHNRYKAAAKAHQQQHQWLWTLVS